MDFAQRILWLDLLSTFGILSEMVDLEKYLKFKRGEILLKHTVEDSTIYLIYIDNCLYSITENDPPVPYPKEYSLPIYMGSELEPIQSITEKIDYIFTKFILENLIFKENKTVYVPEVVRTKTTGYFFVYIKNNEYILRLTGKLSPISMINTKMARAKSENFEFTTIDDFFGDMDIRGEASEE